MIPLTTSLEWSFLVCRSTSEITDNEVESAGECMNTPHADARSRMHLEAARHCVILLGRGFHRGQARKVLV
jgi:hypothetical protein